MLARTRHVYVYAVEFSTGYTRTPFAIMIRQSHNRADPKRRSTLNHSKKQFARATYQTQEYQFRLNLYQTPPTAEITLEQFEQWAIDRLRSKAAYK